MPLRPARADADLKMPRVRPVKKIRVSPEYAAFLQNELDSDGYARSLVSICRGQTGMSESARPRDLSQRAGLGPKNPLNCRGVATPVEYQRFLNEEISSRQYAIAVAEYARLEEDLQAPAAPAAIAMSPSFTRRVARLARQAVSMIVIPMLVIIAAPLFVAEGLSLVPSLSHWVASMVGVVLLAVTAIAASSSTLRGWVESGTAALWDDL